MYGGTCEGLEAASGWVEPLIISAWLKKLREYFFPGALDAKQVDSREDRVNTRVIQGSPRLW